MAASTAASTLPPDLFDQTTIISLLSTLAIVLAAYLTSRATLPPSTSGTLRFLFIWHMADALCHFILEGSFLYHCFFSHVPASAAGDLLGLFPTPFNYLGFEDRVYGAQSGGANPFAQLWMVYARADKRWAGVDLVRRAAVVVQARPLTDTVCCRASSASSSSLSSSMARWPCTSATASPSETPRRASG